VSAGAAAEVASAEAALLGSWEEVFAVVVDGRASWSRKLGVVLRRRRHFCDGRESVAGRWEIRGDVTEGACRRLGLEDARSN
jgi:hypothetical protein